MELRSLLVPKQSLVQWAFFVMYSLVLVLSSIGLSQDHTLDVLLFLPLFLQLPISLLNNRFLASSFLNKGQIWNFFTVTLGLALLLVIVAWIYYGILCQHVQGYKNMNCIELSSVLPILYAPRMLVINFFSFLVLSLCGIVFYFYEDNQTKRHTEMQLLASVQESKLQFLKNQINPHFLFNVLNNIYSLSLLQSEKTPQSILQLSSMLRYVLYECNNPTVSVQEEIRYISNYIELFKLKDDRINNIHFEHHVNSNTMIAPMLFIPFIENSFKHSNFEDFDNGWINISLKMEMNRLVFVCENGMSEQKQSKDDVGGIGIKNVKNRLHAIYPNKHQLSIQSSNNSYHVMLTINLSA